MRVVVSWRRASIAPHDDDSRRASALLGLAWALVLGCKGGSILACHARWAGWCSAVSAVQCSGLSHTVGDVMVEAGGGG